MQLFYAPEVSENAYLDKVNSQHCVKVLRKKTGDHIHLIDGKGYFYEAELLNANPKKCEFNIIRKNAEPKRDRYVHIAITPTKNNNRTEWFVEKAVEIGIEEITFILTKHSERRQISIERMEKIAVAAMKQSIKATLPKFNGLIEIGSFAKQTKGTENKFVAHLTDEAKPLHAKIVSSENLIVIGPEGDFDLDELEMLSGYGFQNVTLGNYRLRTETAGIVACTLFNFS